MWKVLKRAALALLILLALGALGVVGWVEWNRPGRSNDTTSIAPGVIHRQIYRSEPRRESIHIVEIDLAAVQPEVFVPAGDPSSGQFRALTTTSFVQNSGADVAINGSFFTPFYSNHPWDFFPRAGDEVGVIGRVIVDEVIYGDVNGGSGVFCVSRSGQMRIERRECLPGTRFSVPGREILVDAGQVAPEALASNDTSLEPRAAIGLDAARTRLWLVVVDGRQWMYSDGMTISELAELMREVGAATALNLDGGGSATLVARIDDEITVLNSPIHTRIPGRERPVPIHFGMRFE